jgi:hypothetical protein
LEVSEVLEALFERGTLFASGKPVETRVERFRRFWQFILEGAPIFTTTSPGRVLAVSAVLAVHLKRGSLFQMTGGTQE